MKGIACPCTTKYRPDTNLLVSNIELAGRSAAAGTADGARMTINVKASKVDEVDEQDD